MTTPVALSDAGGVVWVDERRGQDRHLVAGDWVGDRPPHEIRARERLLDGHVVGLEAELLGRCLAHEPRLAVDGRAGVGALGVDVGVGHPVGST